MRPMPAPVPCSVGAVWARCELVRSAVNVFFDPCLRTHSIQHRRLSSDFCNYMQRTPATTSSVGSCTALDVPHPQSRRCTAPTQGGTLCLQVPPLTSVTASYASILTVPAGAESSDRIPSMNLQVSHWHRDSQDCLTAPHGASPARAALHGQIHRVPPPTPQLLTTKTSSRRLPTDS
jgi:hypothetical protein